MKYTNKFPIMLRRRRKFAKKYPTLNRYTNFRGNGKIAGTVRFLKGIINAEKNFFVEAFSITPNNAMGLTVMNGIPQGTDVQQCVGNFIFAKSFTYRITIGMNASATATDVRYGFVMDTGNPSGSIPANSRVFQTGTDFNDPINVDYKDQYFILRDTPIALSINGQRNYCFKGIIKLNTHLKYTGTAGSTWDKNVIYFFAISNEATNTPTIGLTTQLSYYDN